jgi:Metalloenzyme superfamily
MIRASGGPLNPRRALFLNSCCILIAALASSLATARTIVKAAATTLKTRAVVLIVLDGFRWQEIFDGPEDDLMDAKHGGAQDATQLRKDFWRGTPEAGREALMPFLWTVVAKQGQIYGNQHKGSVAQVTNGFKFSYPGYNEMASGYPNPQINSNQFGPNPTATVFEWLNNQPVFHNHVAIFGTWDTFNDIFRAKQSGLLVRAGWNLPWAEHLTPREQLLKKLYETSTRVEDDDAPDSFTHEDLLDYLQNHSPRALFVGYGETDDWAHAGRYDLVLQAAHEADQRIAQLWDTMQAKPEYHDQLTFIITCDHGRGSGLKLWRDHDKNIAGAENIWIAVIGPDTPPTGEMTNVPRITQSQIAATIAQLLGQDYRTAVPQAAAPLPVLPK